MTRKKFIKLLMSEGMSRNEAADCATLAQETGRPYLLVSGDLLCFHRHHFGQPLAWIKMRYSIIHGHNSPPGRFFADIDEVHKMDGTAVAAAIKAGTAARPLPTAKAVAEYVEKNGIKLCPVVPVGFCPDTRQGADFALTRSKTDISISPELIDFLERIRKAVNGNE